MTQSKGAKMCYQTTRWTARTEQDPKPVAIVVVMMNWLEKEHAMAHGIPYGLTSSQTEAQEEC